MPGINITELTAIGSPIPQGTSGSILYIDANGKLAQANSNLFYDADNNRVGINDATPGVDLDITGNININGD